MASPMSKPPIEERNWMEAYSLTLATFATITIVLRLYSRIPGQLGIDDVLLVLGWMTSTANLGLMINQTRNYGFNRHIWDVSPALFPAGLRGSYIIAALFLLSTSCTKVSVLLFYRRLVNNVYSPSLKRSLWGAIAFVAIFTVTFLIYQLNQCTPISAVWKTLDPKYKEPHRCMSQRHVQMGGHIFSVLSVLTDFVTVTLPAILIFWKTKIRFTRNQRMALLTIFGLGYLTVAAGIVRTVYLSRAEDPHVIDKTWIAFNAYVAGTAEAQLGFICACAPSLNRLFGHYFRGNSINGSKRATAPSKLSKTGNSTRATTLVSEEETIHVYGKSFLEDASSEKLGAGGYVRDERGQRGDKPLPMIPYESLARAQITTRIEGPLTVHHVPRRVTSARDWPLL